MNRYEHSYKSVFNVVILTLITCGLYHIYWLYDTTRTFNHLDHDYTVKPGMVLFLSVITCGIYYFYWWYKAGIIIQEFYAQEKIEYTPISNPILYLLLAIFGFSIVNVAFLQNDLNQIYLYDQAKRDPYDSDLDNF